MSQPSILIIDDNHDLADGTGIILEDEGYRVTLAYNGCDGIKAFKDGHFDVALIDIKLPDMNGVEVFQNIHKLDPRVGILVMTGYHVEQLLDEVIDSGDVEILRKPVEAEYILNILGRDQKEHIVLIAEDDPEYAEYLSVYLTDHGLSTLVARDCQPAIEGVLSNPVDVLILDLRLPLMYCLALYLELKQRGQTVKTVIFTGCADAESVSSDVLGSALVTGCLFKPFRPEILLQAVKQAMQH